MKLKGLDLLSLKELDAKEIITILDTADRFKKERRQGILHKPLRDKTLAMIFEKPSTRTRVSFEVAMKELGGNTIVLHSSEMQLARGETIEDTARVLSRYVHAAMLRVIRHSDLVKFAEAAPIPVINGLSDLYHPCQILADLQTIREAKGGLSGLKIAWVGDGDNNVANTLIVAAAKLNLTLNIACPREYQPRKEVLQEAGNSKIYITEDPVEAVTDADVVITDTFISMGKEAEREKRLSTFLPRYQVNGRLMEMAKRDAIFLHCLPAHRGEEVTDDVIDGKWSVVWEEAENRLHTQKAILYHLLLL
ncbi:MAG: ornithine carbamoyltransferase [Thaumarchaeota archaeon]|nr:ornithine carbamoyltransferase [Nitrososphaerota archaeon]